MQNRKLKNSELNRKSVVDAKTAQKTPLILILDNIRSLNNIGSVFRTADAFLIEKIYLCGITATPPHKDIQKTALGATDSVVWEYKEDTVAVVAAFVLGNEVKGVQQAVIDQATKVLEIPQEGAKHSLNIAVTTGVVCWDFYQKLGAKKGVQ
jgi:tRNA G18 (ribose-2'-O)-methylase SpoU